MPSNANLFGVTRVLLNVAVVATLVIIGLLVCAAIGVVVSWNNGFLATALAEAAAEIGRLTLSIGGQRLEFDVGKELSVDDVARLTLLAIAGGTVVLALAHLIVRAIRGVVASASAGDPFNLENGARITRIAWLLLGVQIAQVLTSVAVYSAVPATIQSIAGNPVEIPVTGLFTVLLIFVLARIFRHGTEMRADLEGTV